jgi:hypothetical protein
MSRIEGTHPLRQVVLTHIMKFGQVDNPESVHFTSPHEDTKAVLGKSKAKDLKVYVGCAKWNPAISS